MTVGSGESLATTSDAPGVGVALLPGAAPPTPRNPGSMKTRISAPTTSAAAKAASLGTPGSPARVLMVGYAS